MAKARDSRALQSPTCFTAALFSLTLASSITGVNSYRFGLSSDVVLPRLLLPYNQKLPSLYSSAVSVPPAALKKTALQGTNLCNVLQMSKQQQKYCRQGEGMAETLVDAVVLAASQCRQQFQYELWDCNLQDPPGLQILKSAFRETAVLYAFASAALEHSVSRACAADKLKICHCAEASNKIETRQTWKWGGCGDNLRFGKIYATKFFALNPRGEQKQASRSASSKQNVTGPLKPRTSHPKRQRRHTSPSTKKKENRSKSETGSNKPTTFDFRSRIDRHNIQVGLEVVESLVRRTCKCHGVSSSCTMQTCWNQLADFSDTAAQLRMKYESAIKAKVTEIDNIAGHGHSASKKSSLPESTRSPTAVSTATHDYTLASAVWAKNSRKVTTLPSRIKAPIKTSLSGTGHVPIKKKTVIDKTDFKTNKNALVYLDKSPDFCNPSAYGNGTSGRECLKGDNCEVLCCGRGYNIQESTITVPCKCKLISRTHCCDVKCEKCTSDKLVYSCK